MNRWPVGAITREAVSEALAVGLPWRVEWCAGARVGDETGIGFPLPEGVLERVPNIPKKRKFEKGILDSKTWVFAFLVEDASGRRIDLHEGPL